ncbi:MAG: hypothetical protein NVSMB25_07510 [Thermoleophilaceae bacterium]
MSSGDTRALIAQALEHLEREVPSLSRLKLVVRLELLARGNAGAWRIELPGPSIKRDPAGDARLDISIPRAEFNELASKGALCEWVTAYEHGQVRVSGEPAVMRLIGAVIERQLARAR